MTLRTFRHYALVDESTILGGKHARELKLMIAASVADYNLHVAPAYGTSPVSGAFYQKRADAPRGSVFCRIIDTDEEAPDAEAFHDLDGLHVLADVVLNQAGGGILEPGKDGVSLSAAFDHELKEDRLDLFCNDWVQFTDAYLFLCDEVCDPVQDIIRKARVRGAAVALSDCVTPAYFSPRTKPGQIVSLGGFDQAFGMSPGGYQIRFDPAKLRSKDGPIVEVFGARMSPAIRDMKKRALARGRGRMGRRIDRLLTAYADIAIGTEALV